MAGDVQVFHVPESGRVETHPSVKATSNANYLLIKKDKDKIDIDMIRYDKSQQQPNRIESISCLVTSGSRNSKLLNFNHLLSKSRTQKN